MSFPLISIIIPTLNEADNIEAAIAGLQNIEGVEIIVTDGGSTDDTVYKAEEAGARVVRTQTGRAVQMNAGVAAARGELLLFLHGDTLLPPGFAGDVRQALSDPEVAGGAFRLAINAPGPGFRLVEKVANLRSVILKMPYGDQALFLRAEMFRAVDGFPNLPIMEDFEFVRRLKSRGRIKILPGNATTSARRWQKKGIIRTTLINQVIIIGYLLGVEPSRLAKWYRGAN